MIKRITYFSLLVCITFATFSQQTYYSDVNLNLTGIALKQELATKIISTHTRYLSYSEIWDACQATDVNPNNTSEVLLVYGWENGSDADATNDRTRDKNSYSGNSGDWNREHVFSKSLGNPNLGEAGPGSDAHHLRPADVQTNSSRGNRKFSNATGNAGATSETYTDPIDSTVSAGWYPGDEWKGDVARMMMYMYVRYGDRCLPTNIGLGSSSSTPDDMIDLFLTWNVEDPVSDFERARNTYHENTTNLYAQGNRNPFIDNPILATRIWGGAKAADIWGIYTSSDTEAPTVPTNVVASNSTTFSIDISWDAATDNTAVTSYDVYVDGVLATNTTTTSTTISNLESNTTYSFAVLAKDIANNSSALSSTISAKTLQDTTAPSIPTNLIISNETGTSFIVSWDAATDNTAVTSYDVFINGNFLANTSETTYTITDLTISTTYSVQIVAKDKVGNESELSPAVNATTTDGSTTTANELFFSEYVEGSSNNKALEIVNVTDANIDLSAYSIKRQSNGGLNGADWESPLQLSGTINKGDVYVIINGSAGLQQLIDEADFVQANASETNWGSPINFNGNDPMGLFKNDVLIDVVGPYNGGSANFAKDKTLRRKSDVSQPNTAFNLDNEWDIFPQDTVDDIGSHNATLSTKTFQIEGFKIYPNPLETILNIKKLTNTTIKSITFYNLLGKKLKKVNNPNKEVNVSFLSKGIYFLRFETSNKTHSLKIIKN